LAFTVARSHNPWILCVGSNERRRSRIMEP
jgi:hypothetical protein